MAEFPPDVAIGESPDIMQDLLRRYGSLDKLTTAIQAARAGEASADPRLVDLTPEQRAQIDRYTNFAQMGRMPGGALTRGARLGGGLLAMLASDAFKAVPGANRAASAAWNRLQGTPEGASFFGGKDVSKPRPLTNLAASYYGWRDASNPYLAGLMGK